MARIGVEGVHVGSRRLGARKFLEFSISKWRFSVDSGELNSIFEWRPKRDGWYTGIIGFKASYCPGPVGIYPHPSTPGQLSSIADELERSEPCLGVLYNQGQCQLGVQPESAAWPPTPAQFRPLAPVRPHWEVSLHTTSVNVMLRYCSPLW